MPVLDFKVWIDTMSEYPRISYTFFMKKVTSHYTIMRRSKVAENCKKATLFKESNKRISHVTRWHPWNEIVRHMSDWSNRMRISGYNAME